MAEEPIALERPIDVVHLIHKALREEADRTEKASLDLNNGASLQAFKLAFNNWATALAFHAEMEDVCLTAPLSKGEFSEGYDNTEVADSTDLAGRVKDALLANEDAMQEEMMEAIEGVFEILNEEIGKQTLITRTKQHLHGKVVMLRIVQEDHLESEEALVLPVLRDRMTDQQQVDAAKGLLVDDFADDKHWVIDWMSGALATDECKFVEGLQSRFDQPAVSAD